MGKANSRQSILRRLCLLVVSAGALAALTACKAPVSKNVYYENGFLKESYAAYQSDGQEFRHGLYTKWFPSGKKEVEIWYQHGREISKTFYNERGLVVGTVELAQSSLSGGG